MGSFAIHYNTAIFVENPNQEMHHYLRCLDYLLQAVVGEAASQPQTFLLLLLVANNAFLLVLTLFKHLKCNAIACMYDFAT